MAEVRTFYAGVPVEEDCCVHEGDILVSEDGERIVYYGASLTLVRGDSLTGSRKHKCTICGREH